MNHNDIINYLQAHLYQYSQIIHNQNSYINMLQSKTINNDTSSTQTIGFESVNAIENYKLRCKIRELSSKQKHTKDSFTQTEKFGIGHFDT